MIAEIAIAATLGLTGFGVLAIIAHQLPAAARVWVAFPIGGAVYMTVALAWVVATDRVDPGPALAVSGAAGVAGLTIALVKRRPRLWQEGAVLLAGIVAVAALMRVWHLGILSPDSLRYILFSIHVSGPEGLSAVHDADLLNRQLGYPSLHALSALTDRQYLASVGPLFGVSTLGFLSWVLWKETKTDRRRILLVLVSGAFLLSTNRFLYSWFYINAHIVMAAFLLIAVAGTWLALKDRMHDWAWPVGISIGAIVLLRPDSPLFAAVLLAVVAATPLGWRFRIPVVAPIAFTTALWYGLTLFPHPHYQSYMSLTSPVAGNMIAVAGGVLLVLLARVPRLRSLGAHADTLMLAGMVIGFGFLAWRDLEVVGDTAKATVMNVEFGGWMFTWPTLAALTVVALFRHRIPHGRLWKVPVVAFGLLYWILPLLRDGAWRVGTGDSGNRILIHFVAIVVGFIILASARSSDDATTPSYSGP